MPAIFQAHDVFREYRAFNRHCGNRPGFRDRSGFHPSLSGSRRGTCAAGGMSVRGGMVIGPHRDALTDWISPGSSCGAT
ncbi:hypothetical protein RAA17_15965 [Komagataeibacter rhaeticus]|nr:hypothetical protein [Komagataeibacter rhaeticus]